MNVWCLCLYHLSPLLFATTKESRGVRWGIRLQGLGETTALALQMCVFIPPESLVQVRLVLGRSDSHTNLLCTLSWTLSDSYPSPLTARGS